MSLEIEMRNGESFAVLPLHEFERLQSDALMLADIQAFDVTKAALLRGEDEIVPFEIVSRRLEGEHPVKIWREYRCFSQSELAAASQVSRSMIAAIETNGKQGSIQTVKRLAQALQVDLEQLIFTPSAS